MTATEKLLEFQFRARTENLCKMREQLRQVLDKSNHPQETVNCIVLAVGEACMNIMQHAYCGEDAGDIIVEVERQGGHLIFRLTDFAHHKTRQAELAARPLEPAARAGGYGCHIINEIMDEVKLMACSHCGNVLQMTKHLEGAEKNGRGH